MSLLHVFDMDGTLLRSSASVELARFLGRSELLSQLEKLSARGELSNVEFHRLTHPLWQELTDEDVDAVFDGAPWIGNIDKVFSDIQHRNETAIVVSMSPLFFVERLTRWGAHATFASTNPIGAPFDETLILENHHKVEIVRDYSARNGFDDNSIVAYGDSYTDVPLFKSGVRSVAVNATSHVELLATVRYRGDDLIGAYNLGRALISRRPDSPLN